jgi:hypothetical protein
MMNAQDAENALQTAADLFPPSVRADFMARVAAAKANRDATRGYCDDERRIVTNADACGRCLSCIAGYRVFA